MAERSDIVVVGGGVAGLSTAWWLARLGGGRVTLLERDASLGAHSSGRSAAILRTDASDDTLRAMAARTSRFLGAPPPEVADGPLVARCGLVVASEADGPGEALDAARLREIVPPFEACGTRLRLQRDDGVVDVPGLLRGLERAARRLGVDVRTGAAVAELEHEGGTVRGVRLADGTRLAAPVVVLAAGGWAGRLGAAAGSRVRLAPTRRHLVQSAPQARVDPHWPVVWDEVAGFYARPEAGGLLLCACDETPVDPDACRPDPGGTARVRLLAAQRLPRLEDLRPERTWCGMRTFAPDRRPVVGFDPDVPGLFWVAALGGAGISTSSATGELAAALLLGRTPPVAPEGLAPARLVLARPPAHGPR